MKEGSSVVKIYEGKDKGYAAFWVVYYKGKTHVRKRFPALAAAEAEAREIACRLQSGEVEMLSLFKADKEELVHARTAIAPEEMTSLVQGVVPTNRDGYAGLIPRQFFDYAQNDVLLAVAGAAENGSG